MYQVESTYKTSINSPASWFTDKLGQLLFMLLVGLYSIVTLSLQFCLFILKKAPKFLFYTAFYTTLALFGIFLSAMIFSYILLAMISSINVNVP